ncbi:hypothetical protein A2U01_0037570, partial [Trifolium medium]|nr:hypothetical protein [Trifolium medium]
MAVCFCLEPLVGGRIFVGLIWMKMVVGSREMSHEVWGMQEATVSDMWSRRKGTGRWVWLWRRRLFVWEEEHPVGLVDILPLLELSEGEDNWYWGLEDRGSFTIKSVYALLGHESNSGPVFNAPEL